MFILVSNLHIVLFSLVLFYKMHNDFTYALALLVCISELKYTEAITPMITAYDK